MLALGNGKVGTHVIFNSDNGQAPWSTQPMHKKDGRLEAAWTL